MPRCKFDLVQNAFLHVTEKATEVWFVQRWCGGPTLTVAIIRDRTTEPPELWDWCWTRTAGFAFETMSRLPPDSGWETSASGNFILWKRRTPKMRNWA